MIEALDILFYRIRKELDRSFREHPPDEWEKLTPREMFYAVQGENTEFLLADAKGDWDGEHGMLAESYHTACTAIRRIIELEGRRIKENG